MKKKKKKKKEEEEEEYTMVMMMKVGDYYITRNFVICTSPSILVSLLAQVV
jgi:hypothetical protein